MASDGETNAAAVAAEEDAEAPEGKNWRRKGKHDKPKPWDDDPNIDHWKIEKFDPSWNDGGMLEVSSFSTLFPQYRGKHPILISSCLPTFLPNQTRILSDWNAFRIYWRGIGGGIHDCFDHQEDQGSLHYYQGQRTDKAIVPECPCAPGLRLVCCYLFGAIKILDDETNCDIIKIGGLVRNKERFVKRRERLLGPNLSTLKAIEILTGCYILVQVFDIFLPYVYILSLLSLRLFVNVIYYCRCLSQLKGNTVAAMGSYKGRGLKQVRRIVEDCIKNVKHPVYHIKELLIKRELAKNPALATESWDRFLPKFKKKNVKQKKPQTKEKKPYTPYPPPQQPSKIDMQLETGEYFMSEKKKSEKKWQEKLEKQSGKAEENKRKREAAFVPPKENTAGPSESDKTANNNSEMADIAKSLKKKAKEFRKNEAQENVKAESYLASNEESRLKKKKSTKSK
ncbi:KRR1 small subunit processome component-like protein [Dichanthelium oligosanthes]|uniref:KRR1 small subunit processome component-like protein n=1 Tax=Dichanthelium oligosanthes TaxID=888268 RepID=A0A1E5W5J7_9POAL|nr:KRR1 small subunit processome component-like protein [Dichanthelium oligosanthes]